MASRSMLMHIYNFLDSRWKGNLIIFIMAVVPTHSNGSIKIRYMNGLHHVNLDVFATPWRKDNIFGIFGVRHANGE